MVYGHDNKLLYMLHPEGTVSRTEGSAGTSYTYNYFKTDHLGSTRVMLSAVDGALQASQTTDYYPFGFSFENNNLNKNKYLFSGKEFQDGQVNGSMLGWYDFGARFYDPVLGRWFNVDPAVQYTNPYLFCGNAPMMYIDKDGRFAWLAALLFGAWLNVTMHAPKIQSPGGFIKAFAVGAMSGSAGYWTGYGISKAIQMATKLSQKLAGGFINGAIVGSGSGATGGFVSGAGNAWSDGAGFGQGLVAGFAGAGIGLVSGAVTGGLTKGIMDALDGYSFWDGIKVSEYRGLYLSSSEYEVSNTHDKLLDEYLQKRTFKEQGVKKGDYGILDITTQGTKRYPVDTKGNMWNARKNYQVDAIYEASSSSTGIIRVAPNVALGNSVDFNAAVGHEITHAFHHSLYGVAYVQAFSESIAYEGTVNTYMNAGQYQKALLYRRAAIEMGFWGQGNYPARPIIQ